MHCMFSSSTLSFCSFIVGSILPTIDLMVVGDVLGKVGARCKRGGAGER